MIVLAIALVAIIVAIEVTIDVANWGNVKHGWGLFIVSAILIPYSISMRSPFPLLLYAMVFNPTIALARNLPFFYIGNTSTIDKQILKYLKSGKVSFFIAFFLTILSLILWL